MSFHVITGTAGDDTIVGSNGVNNTISGAAGDDLLFGYGDAKGGVGFPAPTPDPNGGGATDNDLLNGGIGDDTIQAGGGNDTLLGGDGIDELHGDEGADKLDGGVGADSMDGGKGDDTYIVDNAADKVVESVLDATGGTDLVLSAVSFTLDKGVENLTLTGSGGNTGTGNDLNNLITGNAAANTLSGGIGNDTLNGMGGVDSMIGGAGNDVFIVDNVADDIAELGGDGIDTIRWTLNKNLDLTLFSEVENATLLGTASVGLTGTGANNVLEGNAGANKIDGGVGEDTMAGGGGSDTYVVDNPDDIIVELPGGGTDTVVSSVDFTISNNLENLTLTGTAIVGEGNDLKNVITGNSENNELDGFGGADTMIGGAGDDTYSVDTGDVVTEALAGKAGGTDTVRWSGAGAYTLGANVENLDLVNGTNGTGNALDNTINGNSGGNTLDGKAGADQMAGQFGDDIYIIDNLGDVANENGGDGTDEVRSSVALTKSFIDVENYVFTGKTAVNFTGNLLANSITGTAAADTLTRGAGDDTLNGAAGADSLVGLDGEDVYVVDNAKDVVSEDAGTGIDTVRSSINFSLEIGATVIGSLENLELTGNAAINGTGNAADNLITGNTAANKLFGLDGADLLDSGAGNDTLDGGQTDGKADTLRGGAGNDLYLVGDGDDAIEDLAGTKGGTDTVKASGSGFVLGANLENLTLVGAAISGTGNDLANIIIGNDLANSLNGSTGADTMMGGLGDDTYQVDSAGDKVVESVGGGKADTVESEVSYILGAEVENLFLTGGSSKGTGNVQDNVINGGLGDDTLDGKAGADSLDGQGGDDTLFVDNLGDVTSDSVGGIDLVLSSVNHTIGTGIDNLTLTGKAANGTGNDLANELTGNSAANSLSGGLGNDTLTGGAGNDTLTGGDGDDVFHFLSGSGKDTITDFLTGGDADVIDISDMLTGFIEGVSDVNDFVQLAFTGGVAILRVDANGLAGGSSFTDVAVVTDLNQSIDQLITGGNLVLT